MANLNGRKVLKAQLNETAHATGLGNVPTTIDSGLGGKPGKTELTLVEQGVFVKGTGPQNQKFEFIIPSAACKLIQLVNE